MFFSGTSRGRAWIVSWSHLEKWDLRVSSCATEVQRNCANSWKMRLLRAQQRCKKPFCEFRVQKRCKKPTQKKRCKSSTFFTEEWPRVGLCRTCTGEFSLHNVTTEVRVFFAVFRRWRCLVFSERFLAGNDQFFPAFHQQNGRGGENGRGAA